jgi:hypothetical protein
MRMSVISRLSISIISSISASKHLPYVPADRSTLAVIHHPPKHTAIRTCNMQPLAKTLTLSSSHQPQPPVANEQ